MRYIMEQRIDRIIRTSLKHSKLVLKSTTIEKDMLMSPFGLLRPSQALCSHFSDLFVLILLDSRAAPFRITYDAYLLRHLRLSRRKVPKVRMVSARVETI